MKKPELPPRALIGSGQFHLLIGLLGREIGEHEEHLTKGEDSALSQEEVDEYQQILNDLVRVRDTGAAAFEVRPWMAVYDGPED